MIVYSCSNSCWNADREGGFKEETVFVVADTDHCDITKSLIDS